MFWQFPRLRRPTGEDQASVCVSSCSMLLQGAELTNLWPSLRLATKTLENWSTKFDITVLTDLTKFVMPSCSCFLPSEIFTEVTLKNVPVSTTRTNLFYYPGTCRKPGVPMRLLPKKLSTKKLWAF